MIPAALEAQINGAHVSAIGDRVRIVAKGASGPTIPEADLALKAAGVFLIPDLLCNSGGVTVSYYESVQNDLNYYWSRKTAFRRLDEKKTDAFGGVCSVATEKGVLSRDAAYMVAMDRVAPAMQFRGWA